MTDRIDKKRRGILRVAAFGVAGLGVPGLAAAVPGWFEGPKPMHLAANSSRLRQISSSRQWLNTRALGNEDFHGKVVLVNFWTYSCINSLRMLPYTRAWHEKYKDHGLVAIGVHTPEFEFEKDIEKVKGALSALDVRYPVVLDSDYAIWDAFGNVAWPALYFFDRDGRLKRRMLGEGEYGYCEKLIQQLLAEASDEFVPNDIVTVEGIGPQAAPDFEDLGTAETYVGYRRSSNFASPGGAKRNVLNRYVGASSLQLNHWSLAGEWTIGEEFAALNKAPGSISFRFHARDLHLVMGRSSIDRPVRFRVKIDGNRPGASHGFDVDPDGSGIVQDDRMYQLIRQSRPISDRTVEIEFLDSDVRTYVFTFG